MLQSAGSLARELQDLPSNVVTPSYLSGRAKAIADENFAFYGTKLNGTPENQPRWKRAVDFTTNILTDGDAGGFDHNAHTLRLVTALENPYPDFDGLNLSWETLEGLAKHNGPVASPSWAMAEADKGFDLGLGSWPSLEAQIAAIADDIAYDNHDIDDGLRSGILNLDALLEQPFVARHWADVERRHPGLDRTRKLKALVRDGIGSMVGDVLDETRRRIADAGVGTIDEVRAAGRQLAGFSAGLQAEERDLKRHLYDNLYDSDALTPIRKEAQRIVADLGDKSAMILRNHGTLALGETRSLARLQFGESKAFPASE